jgi:tetratricopeptide (TPR) repeat protein
VEFGLGTIAARQGRHADAIPHLERAIALYPEFGSAHYALARAYRAVGRRDEAEAALAKHAAYGARWPSTADPLAASVAVLREDSGALLQRGVKQADAGELEQAIASHEAALALNPSFAQAHANLVVLYGRTRNWAKAEEHYRAIVSLAVNVADAHYDFGVILSMQEKWEAAAAAYRKALDLNPEHAQARNNLGQLLERQSKPDEAAAEYQRAVDSQPALRIARFNLGRMLIAQGQHDAAIAELAKLTEPRDAEAPRYLFALATAHLRAGQRDAAIKWATEARALAQRFGDAALAAAIERDLAKIR